MVDEKNGVEKSETEVLLLKVSENKENIKSVEERFWGLEVAKKSIGEIKFFSLSLEAKDGLTSLECREFINKIDMSICREKIEKYKLYKLKKSLENDLKAGEKQ